jgi:hypothetical protein
MIGDISHFLATPDESRRSRRSLRWICFRGWQALVLTQDELELTVVPSIGGRLISIRHGGVELAYVNDALAGKIPDGSDEQWRVLCGEWGFPLWGGGKTWVAPESNWPDGAPQRDLDSGPYGVLATWNGMDSMGVELGSGVCGRSGLQITRRIELAANGVWTTVHRLINRSGEIRECGIWDVLMLRRPGSVSVQLDQTGDQWREAIVPFPEKGPIGDVRGSRFLSFADGVLSANCDDAIEFKFGINASGGALDVRLMLPEGNKRLLRSFDVVADARYLHGAPMEVFNAPALPYFEIESHGPAHTLEAGAACELRVKEWVSSR